MRIRSIALANLKRRKGKAIFLVVGMAIGIATVVALLSLSRSIKAEIGLQLDQFGANIIVVPEAQTLSLDYGGIAVSGVAYDVKQLSSEDVGRVYEIPYRNRLAIVAPKLLGAVNVEGRPVLLAGIDFKDEFRLKRWWRLVGQKPQAEQELVVGYDVARHLKLIEPDTTSHMAMASMPEMGPDMEPGMDHSAMPATSFRMVRDRLTLNGQDHRVTGVLSPTGGREDGMIFGALGYVQGLLNKPGQLSLIEVSALCKDCPVEDIVGQISMQLPHAKVSAIQQSAQARVETVDRLTRFSAAVAAVVLAIGALMIFTTMMGSVIERTREIGVLRAIGFRKSHIIKELLIEVGIISFLGGLIGWAVGTAVGWLTLPYFSESGEGLLVEPMLAPLAIGAALVIGFASSIYPVIRASRLDPSESVRYV